MKKYRSRKHFLLLYPDNQEHIKALEVIKNNYDYAMILHNKDSKEGKLKKEHYHIVLEFPSAKWNTALAQELNITENFIQQCRSLENSLNYLIHYNEPEKFQYSLDDVTGILKKKLEKSIKNDGKDESDKVSELIQYIEDYRGFLTLTNFSKYCSSIGYWDVFRRSGVIFIKILEEKNIKIKKEFDKE